MQNNKNTYTYVYTYNRTIDSHRKLNYLSKLT